MNTFLAKPVIGGKFHLDSYDLTHGGGRQGTIFSTPGEQKSAAADVFRVDGSPRPNRGRRHMAPQLDFDSRALTPVDLSHYSIQQC
jgi:hypothetical protein